MKRYLAFLLALVMVVSLLPVYGDEVRTISEEEAGRKLKNWGALKGSKDGNLMRDEGLKREDAILILIRMMGKEEEAEATPTLPSFKDIEDKYYYPYIAFAQAQGWTEGRSRDEFGYKALVTADEFSALMLRALGYDYKGKLYSKVGDKAEELGLLRNARVKKSEKFRRGSAFVIMYNTLQQPKKDGGDKLAELLGYERKPEPTKFKLDEVKARGLRQIEVVFNKPIFARTLKNFRLKNGKYEVGIKDIRFLEENNRVGILLEKPAKNDDRYKLKIDTVRTEDLSETYKGEVDVDIFDNERPTITELKALGPKLLMFKTSEPLNLQAKSAFTNYSQILIDGRSPKLRLDYNLKNEVLVELYTELKNGSHDVEISGFKDYAGYSIETASMQVEVEEDKEAPVLESLEFISAEKIRLIFNEPLYDKGEFRINDSRALLATSAIDTEDRRIVYLNLNRPLQTKYALLTYHNQRDIMKNRIKEERTYKLELADDSDAPTVIKAGVERVHFVVLFSEPMNKRAGSYTIKQGTRTIKKVSNLDSSYWVDEDRFRIDISNLAGDIDKAYTLILEGFKDAGINALELGRYETTFETVDTKQPLAEEAYRVIEYYDKEKRKFKEISIHFTEVMDVTTIEDPKNYTFRSYYDGKVTRQVRGDQADFAFAASADKKSVVITVLEPQAWMDGIIELTGQKDASGNYLKTKQVRNYTGDVNRLKKAAVIGEPGDVKIEVEFLNPIEMIGDDAFVLTDDAGRELGLSLISNEGTKALFSTYGYDFGLDVDGKTEEGRSLKLKVADPSLTADVYGTLLSKNSSVALEDKVVPMAERNSLEVVSNRRLSLIFTEPMDKTGFVLKLLKEEGGMATYSEGGVEKINTVRYFDDFSISGERKARKVTFQTAGAMERGSYKLVISQAKDRNQNFLNDGYEMELEFFVE